MAAVQTPLVQLRYRVGYHEVDINYEDNARALNLLTRDIRARQTDSLPVAVETYAFTSPDADNRIAMNIGLQRARSLGVILASHNIIPPNAVIANYCGIGWEWLARMVADSDIPNRAAVLEILRTPDLQIAAGVSSEYTSLIISRLKKIDHGATYSELRSRFYPMLRNALIISSENDTARIYYRIGYDEADLSYANNGSRLERVLRSLSSSRHLTISYPVEPAANNRIYHNIAMGRLQKLRNYIASEVGLPADSISFRPTMNGWSELGRLVALSNLTHRREVLEILAGDDMPSAQLRDIADRARVAMLRDIDRGHTYSIIAKRFFPALRNTILARVVTPDTENASDVKDQIIKTIYRPTIPDSVVDGRWSLKTNLLYDALLSPSVELEYHFSPNWSVALEYNMVWWKNTGDNRTYQLAVISPEARRYFSTERSPNGHFVGIFAGFTWYDLAGHHSGHRGDGYFAGATYGYSFRLSNKLSLEAALGLGYLHAHYKDYTPVDGHHVYRRTRNSSYFGPLKARLALVWHFDTRVKRNMK
ncbi:MAG: DUF3575 domain-containing protein [Roseburia sp.]|nr:DUF3575 domain-containing protein [Roseburia sp.]